MYGCISVGEDILCWMFLLGVMPPVVVIVAGSLTYKLCDEDDEAG